MFSQQARDKWMGSFSVSNITLTFTPSTASKPGETVMSTITTAVQTSNNKSLAPPRFFQFATGAFGGGSDVGVGSIPYSVAAADAGHCARYCLGRPQIQIITSS